jgi:hypothetical protein
LTVISGWTFKNWDVGGIAHPGRIDHFLEMVIDIYAIVIRTFLSALGIIGSTVNRDPFDLKVVAAEDRIR